MSAMLLVTQFESGSVVFHEPLKPTSEMKWPLLSARLGTDGCLKHRIHRLASAFKIRKGLFYFERLTKGNAKALDIIYASSGNHIGGLPFACARKKVLSTSPVPYFSAAEKNLVAAVSLSDGRRGASKKGVLVRAGGNEAASFFTSS